MVEASRSVCSLLNGILTDGAALQWCVKNMCEMCLSCRAGSVRVLVYQTRGLQILVMRDGEKVSGIGLCISLKAHATVLQQLPILTDDIAFLLTLFLPVMLRLVCKWPAQMLAHTLSTCTHASFPLPVPCKCRA